MKIYYIYSQVAKCESIYVCSDKNYIDKPDYKTNVYDTGCILSNVLRVIYPIVGDQFAGKKATKKTEYSFGYRGKKDQVLAGLINKLLSDDNGMDVQKSAFDIARLKTTLLNFIENCTTNKSMNNKNVMDMLLSEYKYSLPSIRIHTCNTFDSYGSKPISFDTNSNEIFNPNYYLKPKRFFEVSENNVNREVDNESYLKFPLFVYEISDIVDLMSISLKSIFEENCFIKRCNYCCEIFVTHKNNQKYCPSSDKKTKADKKAKPSCGNCFKYDKQLFTEKHDKAIKTHKNIASMIRSKFNLSSQSQSSPQYREFIDECQWYRESIKNGTQTNDEYIEWMKKYWNELKEEAKIQKRKNSK